jgi:hypothetical protein
LKIRRLVVFCVLLGIAPAVGAARILSASVEHADNSYRIDAVVLLDGELAGLKRLVTDYRRLAALSPSVVRSRILSGRSGFDARVEVVLRPCVLVIFCRTITKVSDVYIDSGGERMRYVTVPELSDFKKGLETVTLANESAAGAPQVRFVYSAVLAPKFFVPPFVGPWLIRRQIVDDLRTSSRRVERLLRDASR